MLLVGFTVCVVVLVNLLRSGEISVKFVPTSIALIVLANISAVTLNFVGWRKLVLVTTGSRVSLARGIYGQALLMIGKYIPGKVMGIAGRAATLHDGVSARSAITLVLLEQFYLVLGLWVLALGFWLALNGGFLGWMGLVAVVLFGGLAPRIAAISLAPFAVRLAPLMPDVSMLERISLWNAFLLHALALASAASVTVVAWWVPDLINLPLDVLGRTQIVAAYAIAVVAGMVALVFPGGIGVREGAFVFLVSPMLGTEAAVATSAMLRIVSVCMDLLMGLLAAAILGTAVEKGK